MLRARLPALPLTLFCPAAEVDAARAEGGGTLDVRGEPSAELLAGFDVVIKSPGISPYSRDAMVAAAQGTQFVGGTALWFAEHAGDDGVVPQTFCVTGTKGKSTTTSLLAHLLRASGRRTALVGNIGVPLLEVLDPQPAPDAWAIELSSYQTGDVAASGSRPDVAIVLNLFPEHLDWHGSEARYIQDKLALVTGAAPRIAVLNAADPHLAALSLPDSEVVWFNQLSSQSGDLRGSTEKYEAALKLSERNGERVMHSRALHALAMQHAAQGALDTALAHMRRAIEVDPADREAFRTLYRDSSAKLMGVLLRMLKERSEAEDALQEVYTRVWLRAGRYDPAKGRGMTWLIAIARNLAIDRLRARPEATSDDGLDTVQDSAPRAETRLVAQGEARRMSDCFATLEPDRDALARYGVRAPIEQ